MAIALNTAHRNAILDATGAVFNGGTLNVRTGAPPGVNNANSGTLLCPVSVPNPAFAAASGGSMAKTGTWSGTVAATGAPGYFRLVNSGVTQWREGNAAEAPGSGETMIIDDLVDGDLIEGGTLVVDTYVITQPAS